MAVSIFYELRYTEIVAALLKELFKANDYISVQQYAAKALHICPHCIDAYYWMLVAMYHSNHSEMARSELRKARYNLLEEEYKELTILLEQRKSEFDFYSR